MKPLNDNLDRNTGGRCVASCLLVLLLPLLLLLLLLLMVLVLQLLWGDMVLRGCVAVVCGVAVGVVVAAAAAAVAVGVRAVVVDVVVASLRICKRCTLTSLFCLLLRGFV